MLHEQIKSINSKDSIQARNLIKIGDVKSNRFVIGRSVIEIFFDNGMNFKINLRRAILYYAIKRLMADDPALRLAVVNDLTNREQKIYYEGQTIGDVHIKQVLRHRVIIATAAGDRLLTINFEETERKGNAFSSRQSLSGSKVSLSQKTGSFKRYNNPRIIQLERDEVETALADTQQVLQELNITPYKFASTPRGIRIGEISPDNILAKMGLRNQEVITGIYDEAIRDVEQAA